MGFNPRLAPYTVSKSFYFIATSKDAAVVQNLPVYRFPFAGQLVGASANIQYKAGGETTFVELLGTTNTGANLMLWKFATDDTTATYATGLRALQRTGAANSTASAGISWRRAETSGSVGLIPFSDNNTASAARKQFNAGDDVMLQLDPRGATDAHREFRVDLQVDYIIGHESGAVASAGTGPA